MENELEIKTWILTCHTAGCVNDEIVLEMQTDATIFFCGPCGNEITDCKDKQNA